MLYAKRRQLLFLQQKNKQNNLNLEEYAFSREK
jgi:hypothetical protein